MSKAENNSQTEASKVAWSFVMAKREPELGEPLGSARAPPRKRTNGHPIIYTVGLRYSTILSHDWWR